MTDAFVAKVTGKGEDQNTWKVTPQIIENDGTTHPDITVGTINGITPSTDDLVLILTTRNNLDNSQVERYYGASEACGRIVAIVTSKDSTVLFSLSLNESKFSVKTNPVNQQLDILQESTGRSAFADGYMTPFGPTVSRIPNGNP